MYTYFLCLANSRLDQFAPKTIHIPEEQPSTDQRLLGVPRRLVHDVQIRGIESKGSGGQTICDQVDPQELHGNQSLGHTKGGGQEDADNL